MKDLHTHVIIETKDLAFAQGDVFFVRIKAMPKGVKPITEARDGAVIAHSETGHHHVARAMQAFSHPTDPNVGYLAFKALGGDTDKLLDLPRIEHLRPEKAHRPYALKGEGVFEFRRQQEYTPEGLIVRVED